MSLMLVDPSNAKPLTDWAKAPSLEDLKADLQAAKTTHDRMVSRVKQWLDNLNVEGSAVVKGKENSSKVVPKLIRKQAEWRYAALSEPFLSTDELFTARPVSWEDKKAAQQNALVLNHQFNNKIDKVAFIDEYVRTAVDEGTVIVRVGWDFHEEEIEVEKPVIEYAFDPSMAELYMELEQLQATNPNEYARTVPEELQAAYTLSMESGQPLRPTIVGTQMVKEMRTVKNVPTLEVCDYRNVIIDPSCKGNIAKASFVIYSFESSTSSLKKDGKYKNLELLNTAGRSILGEPDHSTDDISDFNFKDEPRKKFVVHEYWGYWDIHGNGSVVPIVAAWVDNVMIRMEENPFPDKKIPFVVRQYLPVRKRTHGEPDGHLLEDNQKLAGAVTRGMIDLMGKGANSQTGIRKDALDVTNRRKYDKGLDYEFNPNVHPDAAFYTHKYPEIPQSAPLMLNMQYMEAESITGVKAFSGGISGDALGDVATGVRGALDAASKRELGILRRLAGGMVEIGKKIIAMNGEFLDETEVVRITNEEFISVRRDELQGEFDLSIKISTAEEDNAKAQELAFMLQTVGPNTEQKITLKIMSDIARLRKMPELAKDLETYEPQPDPVAQEAAMLENEKLKAEIAELQSRAQKYQADAQMVPIKAATESAKANALNTKADLNTLDFVEQESGVKQARDLEKQGEQARANMDLARVKENAKAGGQTKSFLKEYLKKAG